MKIKGIILDVDGVIVGSKAGYNWPNPHADVVSVLKLLRSKGIFISLCTGKGTFAIKDIVISAHLDNLHIGDGGAVVIDILQNKIITAHTIDPKTVLAVVKTYQSLNTYVELYTLEGYYILKNEVGAITNKHAAILYREPIIVDSFNEIIHKTGVVKIMPIAENFKGKDLIIRAFEKYQHILSLQWGVHPTALPYQFGIITKRGISKKQAAYTISKATNVSFDHMLGVGDSLTDWEFIKLCNYAGAMGNSSSELMEKIKTKVKGKYIIGPPVDNNGLLDIFSYFKLI